MAESVNPWKIIFILRCERVADGTLVRFDYGTGLVLANNPNYKRYVHSLAEDYKDRRPIGIRLKDGVIEVVRVPCLRKIVEVFEDSDPLHVLTADADRSSLSRSHPQFEELLTQLKHAASTGQVLWCLEDGNILAVHPYEPNRR